MGSKWWHDLLLSSIFTIFLQHRFFWRKYAATCRGTYQRDVAYHRNPPGRTQRNHRAEEADATYACRCTKGAKILVRNSFSAPFPSVIIDINSSWCISDNIYLYTPSFRLDIQIWSENRWKNWSARRQHTIMFPLSSRLHSKKGGETLLFLLFILWRVAVFFCVVAVC